MLQYANKKCSLRKAALRCTSKLVRTWVLEVNYASPRSAETWDQILLLLHPSNPNKGHRRWLANNSSSNLVKVTMQLLVVSPWKRTGCTQKLSLLRHVRNVLEASKRLTRNLLREFVRRGSISHASVVQNEGGTVSGKVLMLFSSFVNEGK